MLTVGQGARPWGPPALCGSAPNFLALVAEVAEPWGCVELSVAAGLAAGSVQAQMFPAEPCVRSRSCPPASTAAEPPEVTKLAGSVTAAGRIQGRQCSQTARVHRAGAVHPASSALLRSTGAGVCPPQLPITSLAFPIPKHRPLGAVTWGLPGILEDPAGFRAAAE